MARDKELSAFRDHSLRIGGSYAFGSKWRFIERGTINFFYNHIEFDYDNFRDVTAGGVPGQEPLYGFGAIMLSNYI